jgi:hypothetical protein
MLKDVMGSGRTVFRSPDEHMSSEARGSASIHVLAADFNPLLTNHRHPARQLLAGLGHHTSKARNAQPLSPGASANNNSVGCQQKKLEQKQ